MFDLDLSLDSDSTGAANASHGYDVGVPNTEEREFEEGRHGRIRRKPLPRPKSYHQILEDFQSVQQGRQYGLSLSPSSMLIDSAIEENSESPASEGGEDGGGLPLPSPPSMNHLSQPPSPSPRRRREDTARRSKRFSLPAVALHTANVTARTTSMSSGSGSGSGGNGNSSRSGGASGGSSNETTNGMKTSESGAMGRLRRLSLVAGARN